MTYRERYSDCLTFINSYWDEIIHDPKESQGDPHVIPLPNPFLTPVAKSHWRNAMFYWDNFFMFRGLVDTDREWVVPGMIDNFVHLFNQYGIIPNLSAYAFLGHSQPPLFSSMIFDAFYVMQRASGKVGGHPQNPYIKHWLENHINIAKQEYWNVWEDAETYTHKVREFNLSRYGDRDVGYALTSERESGWDFTTRFYNRCNDFLPIDLNSFLHKYEKDFAKTANILGKDSEEEYWEDRAALRHATIKKHMWNSEEGFFFDYDFVNNVQSKFYSLAGFVPLWAKLATYEEAKRVREKLPLFETEHGLTITAKVSLPDPVNLDHIPEAYRISIVRLMETKQWDYPNIWPPLEYLTVIGLLRYGFIEDAARIMKKSLHTHNEVFKKFGKLFEKVNAENIENGKSFAYPHQLGFGWTNAIFYRYVQILDLIEEKDGKIFTEQTLEADPPYSLTGILH